MKKILISVFIFAGLVFFDISGARTDANPSNDNGFPAIMPGIGYGVHTSTFAAKPPLSAGLRENAFTIMSAKVPFKKNRAGRTPDFRTAGIFTAGSPYPRVITPNGDHENDYIFFFFETTDAPADGKIYDLNSAFVASMKPLPGKEDESLIWDGKDDRGRVVPMGVYLYKVAIGDENITGTVVVAW